MTLSLQERRHIATLRGLAPSTRRVVLRIARESSPSGDRRVRRGPCDALRAYLEASGESQERFAARVGCRQSMVSRVLDGKAVPGFALAIRMAKVANIPVESLAPEQVGR